MGELVRVEFETEDQEVPDPGEVIFRAMREARRRTGRTVGQWAGLMTPRVGYGTVTTGAVETYEAGRNVPGADYYLTALAAAGLPIHRVVELWLDPHTSSLVRWLISLLATHHPE
jgi:hypothetical protein